MTKHRRHLWMMDLAILAAACVAVFFVLRILIRYEVNAAMAKEQGKTLDAVTSALETSTHDDTAAELHEFLSDHFSDRAGAGVPAALAPE